MAEVCEAALDTATSLAPDLIVVSGDLTQRARQVEFEAARDFLAKLPDAPQLVVPGNHDVPLFRVFERMLSPLGRYRETIHPEPTRSVELPGAIVVGLDSTHPYGAISGGRVKRDQLEFCESAFSNAGSDDWRVVVMHHHLVPAPTFDRTRPMPKARRTLEYLTELKVDLVLAGHLHRSYIGNSLDVYAGSRRESGIVVVQCGTSTSRRGRWLEREANSMNWIEIDEDHVDVSHFMYFGTDKEFSAVSRHRFARPRAVSLASGLDETFD